MNILFKDILFNIHKDVPLHLNM